LDTDIDVGWSSNSADTSAPCIPPIETDEKRTDQPTFIYVGDKAVVHLNKMSVNENINLLIILSLNSASALSVRFVKACSKRFISPYRD